MEKLSALPLDTIVFPKLGIELNIDKTAFTVFGFNIMWYGVMIAAGVFLAMFYCFRRMKKFGLDEGRASDAVIAGILGGIIGARGYYVILEWERYSQNIKEIFLIRDGGLAIYGGIIGALLVGGLVAKIRKVKLAPLLDLTGMGFLIGQAFGRWGNFFNQECFGGNTSLPWGMSGGRIQNWIYNNMEQIFNTTGETVSPYLPVHPCFLYESLWCVLGFVLLHFYAKHRKFDGEIFLIYIGWYGLGRFFIEGMRTDSLMIGALRISQVVAGICFVAAVILIIVLRNRVKRNGYTFYCDTEESKALLAQAEEKDVPKKKRQKDEEYTALYKEEAEDADDKPASDEKSNDSETDSNDGSAE